MREVGGALAEEEGVGGTMREVGGALAEEEGAEVKHSVVYLSLVISVRLCRRFWRRQGKIIVLFRKEVKIIIM